MNYYDSLKLLALGAVMKPDGEASYRSICRWYSTTFHTPLHTVEDLPEEEVLQAYFESTYEDMSDEDRVELLKRLLETDEEKKARLRRKDAEDAESFNFARQIALEAKQEAAKKKIAEVQAVKKAPSMLSAKDRAPSLLPESKSTIEKLEPDVSIKFVDAEDFEKELEGFGSMMPKETK